MDSVGWPAPAKLNLFLHITGRREDGYHLLQTLFQFLDSGDTLHFSIRRDGEIRRHTDLPGVPPESDLIIRAAHALQAHCHSPLGVDIHIDKRLPMGAGLGGGSSNAATTLLALNQIWGCHLPATELTRLGLQLGADLPIFLHGRAAWAEGVGEQLTELSVEEPWYVVIIPPVHVSTAEIFQAPELTRDCRAITIRAFLEEGGANVFQPVVRKRYPVVGEVIDWLSNFSPARLTGSGAAVFASFDHKHDAEQVLLHLPTQWRGFVAKGRNRSPLLERLEISP